MSKMLDQKAAAKCTVADVSRRQLLGKSALTVAVLAAGAVAVPRPAHAKLPKKTVNYKGEPEGDKNCANCKHLLSDKGACKPIAGEPDADGCCKKVKGLVSPNGWCSLWSKPRG